MSIDFLIYNPLGMDGVQKVVQLYVAGEPGLLYGGEFHYSILERFLEERKIPFEPIALPSGRGFGPPLRSEGFHVVGMGEGNLYFAQKLFTGFGGSSADYGIQIDGTHAGLVKDALKRDSWKII